MCLRLARVNTLSLDVFLVLSYLDVSLCGAHTSAAHEKCFAFGPNYVSA
jgi:hypothetical protein